MTDGNTATQVSPVQEEDMAKVREVFQKALDAIIAATELSKTVHAMRSEVDQLRKDIEDTQARNVELDRMLADTRRQRDEAEHNLASVRNELDAVLSNARFLQSTVDANAIELNKLKADLEASRKASDNHALEAMDLQDVLDKANAKLEAMHKAMGVEFKPFAVEKPQPPASEPAQAPPPVQQAGESWNPNPTKW